MNVKTNTTIRLRYNLKWSDGSDVDIRKQTGLTFVLTLPDDTTISITDCGYDALNNQVWVAIDGSHTATAGTYKGNLSVITTDLQMVTTGIITLFTASADGADQESVLALAVTAIETPINIGQGYSPKIVNSEWYVYDDSKKAYVATGQSVVAQSTIDSAIEAMNETFEENEEARDAKVDAKVATITEIDAKVFGNIENYTFVASGYSGNDKGWTACNGAEPALGDGTITQISYISNPYSMSIFENKVTIAAVTIDSDSKILTSRIIAEIPETTKSHNVTMDVQYTLYEGEIVLFKGLAYNQGDNATFFNDGTINVGDTLGTYALNANCGYSLRYKDGFDTNVSENTSSIAEINDKLTRNRTISYEYVDGYNYNKDNVGWTAASGSTAQTFDGKITSLTVYSHKTCSSTYGGNIYVRLVTLDSDNIITAVSDVATLTSSADATKQTFIVDISIKKGQLLMVKGIGFASSPAVTTFFATSLPVGNTLGTYAMTSPIGYTITSDTEDGEVWSAIHKNEEDIASIDKKTSFEIDFSTKRYISFGDSITDDAISAMGTMLCSQLGAIKVANWARGNATLSDYATTTIDLSYQPNEAVATNVVSNQVRRMLQWTTSEGETITWEHPIDGDFSIDSSYGVGLGHTSDIPDVIYIAAGTNDTKQQETRCIDDCDTVFAQTYSQLTRTTIASALRWAIETLQCAYPNAQIFVASPLQSSRGWTWGEGGYTGLRTKNTWETRAIIEKVCAFCSVNYIDSFAESGFSNFIAQNVNDGIHPTGTWATYIAKFLAKNVRNRYINR